MVDPTQHLTFLSNPGMPGPCAQIYAPGFKFGDSKQRSEPVGPFSVLSAQLGRRRRDSDLLDKEGHKMLILCRIYGRFGGESGPQIGLLHCARMFFGRACWPLARIEEQRGVLLVFGCLMEISPAVPFSQFAAKGLFPKNLRGRQFRPVFKRHHRRF